VKVKVAGVGNMAPFVIVSSDFGHSKPEPPIFYEALRRLWGIPAENTLFVGDNPDTDIKGAQAVGMQTAWVRLGRHFPEHPPSGSRGRPRGGPATDHSGKWSALGQSY
jgi:putative hydrolase of the HAD superfamily